MSADDARSLPVWALDERTRSFLLALALGAEDIEQLAGEVESPSCGCRVSRQVLCVNRLHAATAGESELSRRVGDRLDLRHLERLLEVRASDPLELRERVHALARAGRGAELVPYLWPLASDPRAPVRALGAVSLCEAFLAGCALAREHAAATSATR